MKTLILENTTKELVSKDIEEGYKSLQREVDGLIECPVLSNKLYANGVDTYINEEGKLLPLEPSAVVFHEGEVIDVVAGNIVFVGYTDEGKTIGLTDEQETLVRDMFENPSILAYDNGGRRYPVIEF